jgi:hypothetical protein
MKNNQNLDWMYIQKLLIDMVSGLLKGHIEQKNVNISLTIPIQMLEIFEYIAKNENLEVNTIIAEYASEGINNTLQTMLTQALTDIGFSQEKVESKDPLSVMQSLGIDTTNLQSTLTQLNDLAKSIETQVTGMNQERK